MSRWVGVMSDEMLLQRVHELRQLGLELDNPAIAFSRFEWDGQNRQEASAEIHRELLEAIDECKRRGLDCHAQLWPDG